MMKKRNTLLFASLLMVIPLTSCGKDYGSLIAHKHTYNPASLSWNWTEKSDGGFNVKVIASCSLCDEKESGHTASFDATVKGPIVVKENRCGVEGEISYTASVTIQNISYYQTRFVTTQAMEHEEEEETLYSDDDYHWHQCEYCLKIMNKEPHDYTEYVRREGTFYFDRECKVCAHKNSYFSTSLFNESLAKFDKTTITPFDKKELDDAKAIYETLEESDKVLITNYKKVEECYKALEDFYAQWDLAAGSVWTVLGNTIPKDHYVSDSHPERELLFTTKVDSSKGTVLAMEVKKDFSLAEDFGFYGNGFEKNLNYTTGVMMIYCPEQSQSININASTEALELTANLIKGWNRIDFNKTQWNKLNIQTYQQIRFTFNNPLKTNSDPWLFSTAYGRLLDTTELYNKIEALPSSIDDLAPYRITELNEIKNQYDSLNDKAKSKITNISKVINLIDAYSKKYQKTVEGTFAWYELFGNTLPEMGLYKGTNQTLSVGTDTTERGNSLTIKCVKTFTNDAGFYLDVNKFSMMYDGNKVYSKLFVYVYAPCAKTVQIRHRLSGENYDTGILKTFNCVEGWNEIILSASEIATMTNKDNDTLKNTFVLFFQGGLESTMGTFKLVVPYGAK